MNPFDVLLIAINSVISGMSSLMIMTNVSLLSVLTLSMIMTIVIWIVKGIIRHNGNS